ncbi:MULTISPECIES: hypothetical protein [Streptomyces]|uniref:hypothetical protein n=1 Tax=Streptomyces TaxID=1883 RepID=UPI0004CDC8C7|nr:MULTISPECIES: hypothetical protein [Streptomyces]KOT52918.1 hypothetical protein ADK43_29755 [Streptomyces rimosus subsp. rimosus]
MRRVLLFLVAALLAFPVGGEKAYGRAAESRGTVAAAPGTGVRTAVAPYAYEDGGPADPTAEHCPTGRATRSATGIPGCRTGDPTRCAGDPTVPPAERPSPAGPVGGTRAIPLTRSGQLPVSHRVFRC